MTTEFTATEEEQLVIRVCGEFGFVFVDLPRPCDSQRQLTYEDLMTFGRMSHLFNDIGARMLRQLLSLHRAVSMTITSSQITITFSIGDAKVNRPGIKSDVLNNIKYFAAKQRVATG